MSQPKRTAGMVVTTCALVVSAVLTIGAQAPNSQPNPYKAPITDFFKLSGARQIGSTIAVDIDPDGRSVWIFERCGASANTAAGTPAASAARRASRQECEGSDLPPVLKFDQTGKQVRGFGAGVVIHPHGFHVDAKGNVWITDGASSTDKKRGHQVFKFSPTGELLLTLGRPGGGDGLSGPDFFQPSDVVTAPNGAIFVADGHGDGKNGRIVKFSPDGHFVKAWGQKGTGPGEFAVPHGVAMDSRGRLFVADRENWRIEIFDQDGAFIAEWKQFGTPSGLFIDRNDTLYVADARSGDVREGVKVNPLFRKGIRIGSAKDGSVTGFVPDPDPAGSQEGVAVDTVGNLYVAQSDKQAINRYVKK